MIFVNKNITEEKSIPDILEYIAKITTKTAYLCISSVFLNDEQSILMVEIKRINTVSSTIWLYQKSGICILFDLPSPKNQEEGFRCDFYNFTGQRCLYSWPGKKEGILPF